MHSQAHDTSSHLGQGQQLTIRTHFRLHNRIVIKRVAQRTNGRIAVHNGLVHTARRWVCVKRREIKTRYTKTRRRQHPVVLHGRHGQQTLEVLEQNILGLTESGTRVRFTRACTVNLGASIE